MNAIADWFSSVFQKLGEMGLTDWISVGALLVLGGILFIVARITGKWTARMLSYAAVSIALSFVLSFIRLFRMPQGGSVTPGSMLPLLLFAAAYGAGPGMLAGLCYGLLQYLQGGWFLNVFQLLLDYPIAFAMLGLAGLYKHLQKKWQTVAALALPGLLMILLIIQSPDNWILYGCMLAVVLYLMGDVLVHPQNGTLFPALVLAVIGRAVSAVAAGIMWLSDGGQTQGLVGASLIYNGAYLVPEAVICLILARLCGNRLLKYMK